MASLARPADFIDQFRDLKRRVRRLEVRKGQFTSENFILDPVTTRDVPPGYAVNCRVVSVAVRIGSEGPITVSMMVVRADPPVGETNPWPIHTFASVTAGAFQTAAVSVPLQVGDWFYPSITAGSARDFTATFVIAT